MRRIGVAGSGSRRRDIVVDGGYLSFAIFLDDAHTGSFFLGSDGFLAVAA
jgi:hypothetical protein